MKALWLVRLSQPLAEDGGAEDANAVRGADPDTVASVSEGETSPA